MNETIKKTETRGHPKTAQTKRPTRIPMSGSRKRMHIPEEFKDPSFHYAWINDQNDLMFRAKRAGYENVYSSEMPEFTGTDVDASSEDDSLISLPVGQGVTAYLMKQPIDFYEEDLLEKRKINNDRVADIKKELNSGQNGTYGNVDIS